MSKNKISIIFRMTTAALSEEDFPKLQQALNKQKKSGRTALIVSIVLNGICWSLYVLTPSGEVLGYALVAIVVSMVLFGISFKSGKKLKLDLREKKKEIIEGEIKEKSTTQFKYSTHYEFLINGEKISVDQQLYNMYAELESVRIERTVHARILISSGKI